MITKKLLALVLSAITVASVVRGETVCSGRSASVKLDLRTGVRTTTGGPETVVYDAAWYAGGATVRIEGMGTTPVAGTAGTAEWTPSCPEHHLSLQAFNPSGSLVGSETADFSYAAGVHAGGVVTKPAVEPTSCAPGTTAEITCTRCGAVLQQQQTISALGYVRNVTARQLWPHKKIEVCYDIADDIENGPNDSVALTVSYGSTTKNASTSLGDVSSEPGHHVSVWDFEADSIAIDQANATFTVTCPAPAEYCVIDLSAGANASVYPVSYMAMPPEDGFNADEYKTTKLVLRRIKPGSFAMLGRHSTSLTKPYYLGVFEVTQKQYELVVDSNPSNYKGDKRPVERVSYDSIRGASSGSGWPDSDSVDSASFLGKLRRRTGLDFDLPTEAQWEYACRAGTTSDYNNGGSSESDLKLLGRYSGDKADGNGGCTDAHTVVGSYLPNAWGLYDMHGNVWEWCLDWFDSLSGGGMDPTGPSTGASRVTRGGSWYFDADSCTSSSRSGNGPANEYYSYGFRLAAPVMEVTPRSPGLSVKYYDVSSSGYSTWTSSETTMTNYFASKMPTISAFTTDWGETLQSGFQNDTGLASKFSEFPGLWLDTANTNRYHGKYANASEDTFAMLLTGFLFTDVSGQYSFGVSCDDEIVLYIDGSRVCYVNGFGSPKKGTLALTEGVHRIAIATYENSGSQGMFVAWKRPGDSSFSPIPQSVLSRGAGGENALPCMAEGSVSGVSINTSSSVKDGMSVSGTVDLGYSPFGDGEATLLIDGTKALSSTNSGTFAWMPRTPGTHTLKHVSGSYTWTRTVNVTGLDYYVDPLPNPPTSPDANISIGSTSKSFGTSGGSGSIVTSGSGTWTATASDDWITIPAALSSRNAGLPVVYQVAANSGVEPRTGYVYVSGHVFTITQAGVGATLDRSSASFETDGGTGAFTVLADAQTSWRAKSNVDWISVATTTGTGEAEVAYTVAPFNEVSTRSGTITAAGCTFTVNQTGRRLKIWVSGSPNVARPLVERDYQSHVIDVQVNALFSTAWDVEPDSNWISVVDAGNGRGGDNVAIAINENPSWLARDGTVRIGTETLFIRQAGRPSAALAFSISPESTDASVKGANGLVSVFATPDLPWTAQSRSNWLTVQPLLQTGAGNGNIVYSASPNPTMSSRTGTIAISATEEAALPMKTHTVTQPAATSSISATGHAFDPAGESYGVDVTVDDVVNWTISENSDWISIVGGTSRVGPGTVTITATGNPTVEPRSVMVTIAGHLFAATQKGRSVQVEYESKVFGTETDYATLDVHPDGNATWTAVSSAPDWLTIWGGEGCTYDQDGNVVGTGDNTIEYIVADYVGDGSPRTATITIGDKTVFITQRAYELSINPSATWVSGNAGAGEFSVSASVDSIWNAIATDNWFQPANPSGTGSGTVRFTYTDNDTGEERTGKIVIAGETYTITQAARQMVTVSARVEGGKGFISGTGTYDRGTSVALSATAQDGYEFLNWMLPNGVTRTGSSLSVTADVDKEIVANFRRIPYYDVNGESVREGTSMTFTAPADMLDAVGTTKLVCRGTSRYPDKGRSFTLVVTEDVSFEWDLWTTNYLVSVSQSSNGTIKRNGSSAGNFWAAVGSTVDLTATPKSGRTFFRWTGSVADELNAARSAGVPYQASFVADAPATVSAVFGVFADTLAEALDAPALAFTTGGDAAWAPVVDATAGTGYTSARSGAGGADTDTWLDTTVEGAGTLSFRWRVDCEKDDGGEATWDRLAVFVNGVEFSRIDGKTDWETVTIPVSGPKTIIRWSFYRDDWDDPGPLRENAGWIDGVTFATECATLDAHFDGATKQGDGQSWTPTIIVKGGDSGFYRIKVEK